MSKLANIKQEILTRRTDERAIIDEFNKPIMENIFYINKLGMILDETTKFVKFNENKWERNPKQFCLDTYGLPEFYLIILLLNNIGSQFGFISENFPNTNIITPSLQTIINTLSYRS